MLRTVALLALFGMPTTVLADGTATSGMRVSLTVPEVCKIEASPLHIAAEGTLASGAVHELCNSGRVFQIVASHRPLDDGERVWMSYGAETTALNKSGISGISNRSGPVARRVPVAIRSEGLQHDVTISLGIATI